MRDFVEVNHNAMTTLNKLIDNTTVSCLSSKFH
jgi:hypothetical protein